MYVHVDTIIIMLDRGVAERVRTASGVCRILERGWCKIMPRPVGRGSPGPGAEPLVGVQGAKPPAGGMGGFAPSAPPEKILGCSMHITVGKRI